MSLAVVASEVLAANNPVEWLKASGYIVEDVTTMTPGMYAADGILYYTVPVQRKVKKTIGKGKAATQVDEIVTETIVISSKHEVFPYNLEEVQKRGWKFPQTFTQESEHRWPPMSWGEFIQGKTKAPTGKEMFSELRKIWFDHVEYGEDIFYDLLPLYVMGTYVYRIFQSMAYIHFNGTRATGKSQNLRLIRAFGFNTKWAANISSASLYRQIAGAPGIICVDEAESFEGERGEELRRLLNAGYIQGETAMRTEAVGDSWIVKSYEVFAPKAIASINPLEPTIQTRCIVVPMMPAIRKIPEFDFQEQRWATVRSKLYLWALEHAGEISDIYQDWNTNKRYRHAESLANRAWQTSQIFIVMADHVGGQKMADRMVTFFDGYFAKMIESQTEADKQLLLLKCLPRVIGTKQAWHNGTAWALKDIHATVSEYLEEDAKEFYKTKATSKQLMSLGFTERIQNKGGLLVPLDEEAIRNQFRVRHITPFDEDIDWFEGRRSYRWTEHPAKPAEKDYSWLDDVEA